MKNRVAVMALAIASLAAGSSAWPATTHPYFEFTGGDLDAEMTVPTGNFIPSGALELDSVVISGVPQPVTVILRDPGYDGAPRRVCVDYIGTDALFQDRFTIVGTPIDWCNKASCATPTATPLGLGNRNWTGPFTATACFQMNVGQPVPFIFVSDILNQGGDGPHSVANGQAVAGAHWGVFPYPFVFTPPIPNASAVIGVGLADGAYNPAVDDDHQDFVVRFTVEPAQIQVEQIPTLSQWGMILLMLAVLALGLRYAGRARR